MKAKAQNEHDKGLLEYLEDIIRTSKYKEPIDEAIVEMERLPEEHAIKMDRLWIVEKEKKSLENQKKEVEDYHSIHVIDFEPPLTSVSINIAAAMLRAFVTLLTSSHTFNTALPTMFSQMARLDVCSCSSESTSWILL